VSHYSSKKKCTAVSLWPHKSDLEYSGSEPVLLKQTMHCDVSFVSMLILAGISAREPVQLKDKQTVYCRISLASMLVLAGTSGTGPIKLEEETNQALDCSSGYSTKGSVRRVLVRAALFF
jgi:hypothetical protein